MHRTQAQSARQNLLLQILAGREWNPIAVREGRARWRGSRAYWLALSYASFLAFVLWWGYTTSQRYVYGGSAMDSVGAAAKLGHDLFTQISSTQIVLWLILAPIMTASALSGEREKGLLEGLLLSSLTPTQVVRGKLASALGLIVLLVLAGLPVLAVCFLLGGVSPGEFVGALALQLATAVCGASIGLAVSANHRRTTTAASSAIGGVLAWLALTGLAIPIALIRDASAISAVAAFIASANPFAALAALIDPTGTAHDFAEAGLARAVVMSGYSWIFSVASMALLAAWRLHAASATLKRSPETFDRPAEVMAAQKLAASTYAPLQSDAAHARWAQIEDAYSVQRWEMPLLNRLVFGNALMRRELSASWRMRKPSEAGQIGLVLVVLFLGWLLMLLLSAAFSSANEGGMEAGWWVTFVIYGLIGGVVCAMSPAMSIAQEREDGAWQELRLTLLSPLQITQAILGARLVSVVAYGALAWLMLGVAAWYGRASIEVLGVPHAALMIILWAQAASWSIFCGARARTSATAMAWSIGGLLFAWGGIPLLAAFFSIDLPEILHPVMGFVAMADHKPEALLALGIQAQIAALLFALALGAVDRSQRAEAVSTARTS